MGEVQSVLSGQTDWIQRYIRTNLLPFHIRHFAAIPRVFSSGFDLHDKCRCILLMCLPLCVADIPNPRGFAIDWLSGNMYFSSYGSSDKGSIAVAQLSGAYHTILVSGIHEPNSLVIHPTAG